jgi:hypothetical protein
MIINNKIELLQIKFSVKESPKALLEVSAYVGAASRGSRFDGYKGNNFYKSEYRGYPVNIKVIGVSRKDRYAGPCEDYVRSFDLKAEYCICEDRRYNLLE